MSNDAAMDGLTDEELWNSPVGLRLRHYADKLLAAEQARVELVTRNRANQAGMMAGLEGAREVTSPLGATFAANRKDPWGVYRSPELEGLRAAVRGTDGTVLAVQRAAKAYIASLQGEEVTEVGKGRPYRLTVTYPEKHWAHPLGGVKRWAYVNRETAEKDARDKATDGATAQVAHVDRTTGRRTVIATYPATEEKAPATPTDVAGALSHLLTGHEASDRGPFAVHEADGFHDEPYVMLPLDAMRKVLDEIPEERW